MNSTIQQAGKGTTTETVQKDQWFLGFGAEVGEG